jgi:hypothetical protein
MEKKIIIINGSGGVGKDSFVEFCRPYANITNISSVDKIKEAAKLIGWDGGKTEEDRKFLSDLKILSTNYNDFAYNYIKDQIEKFRKDRSSFTMFIHVREPDEIDRIKNDFNCVTLLIKNINKGIISSNMADANVEKYDYDYVIHNDQDLAELKRQAVRFINVTH